MGTKVHHTSYMPGFSTMRDLNEDADGCWSGYYEDKVSGQNLYNGYQLRPSNGYSDYDKEMLKRTMLEHEAVFRKQVYELHRIYRIQKDMMDELKRGASRHLQSDASQSNSFSSQIPSEGTNKMFQMAHLPEATTSNNGAPLTVTEDTTPILNFLHESNMQSSPFSIGKEVAPKGDMFESNQKGLAKRTFDLQLPAEVYIDCDDERSEKEIVVESSLVTTVLDRIQCLDPENNVKLNLTMAKGRSYREDSLKSDIHTRGGSTTCNLADLNEPAGEICFGKASGSVSAKFSCLQTSLAENQGLWLPTRSNTKFSGLPSAFLKARHYDEGTSSNHLCVDDETSRGWPSFNNETGQRNSNMESFCPRTSKGKFPVPSQQKQLNQNSLEVLSLDQNKRDAWFKPQHEISQMSPPDGRASLPFPNSFSGTFLDYTDDASPLRSSWTKPANGYSHVPLADPSLQYLNGTATENHGNPYDKWQYSGDLRSHMSGVGPSSYQNGFRNGAKVGCSLASQLHTPPFTFGKTNLGGRIEGNLEGCGAEKSQKDVHFNPTLRNGFQNGFSTPKINEPDGKCEDISGALSWLRGKPTSKPTPLMQLDLSQGYPQLKCAGNVMNLRNEIGQETEKSRNLLNLQDLLSSHQFKQTTTRNVTPDGQSSKKIFGFSIPERTHQSAAFAHAREQSQTDGTESNEKETPKLPILGTQIPHGDLAGKNGSIASGNHINLNFDLNSSDLSAEGEMLEAPSQVPAPSAARQIDLEAPIMLEEENPDKVLAKEAAESILLIASEKKHGPLHDIPCHPPSSASYSSLYWFAGVVTSNPEIVKGSSEASLDSFEMLTMELEETKPEEFWCRSREGRDQNDEGGGKRSIASLLFTKHRRGQARKRRQKRDFQRDILPGIASLSRHEVTKDLQAIGTLMKASGQSWQAGGTTRRNAGRNGTASRGRVGRRPRSLAVTVEEVRARTPPHPSPPPQPPAAHPANVTAEIEVDGRSMIGWGRTTRRCRRQRLPPVTNVAAPLT